MKITTEKIDEDTIKFHITFDSKPNRSDYEKAEDRVRTKLRNKGVWAWGGLWNGTTNDSIIAERRTQ